MNEKKLYLEAIVDVILFDTLDVIRTSNPVLGEDGDDIFDDR